MLQREGFLLDIYSHIFTCWWLYGTLDNGVKVAIKKLMNLSNHGKEQFLNEVKLIRSLQHRNLVRIIGCCVEGEDDSMFLVYEYVSNQSLDKHLFGNVIFIVYYFYMILSKYNLILFPFLSFFLWVSCFHSLLLGFIFLMISTSITM